MIFLKGGIMPSGSHGGSRGSHGGGGSRGGFGGSRSSGGSRISTPRVFIIGGIIAYLKFSIINNNFDNFETNLFNIINKLTNN